MNTELITFHADAFSGRVVSAGRRQLPWETSWVKKTLSRSRNTNLNPWGLILKSRFRGCLHLSWNFKSDFNLSLGWRGRFGVSPNSTNRHDHHQDKKRSARYENEELNSSVQVSRLWKQLLRIYEYHLCKRELTGSRKKYSALFTPRRNWYTAVEQVSRIVS